MDRIEKLAQLAKIEARPGDRFVLLSEEPLTREAVGHIRAAWEKFWDGSDFAPPSLLFLDGGLKLGVVRQEGDDQCLSSH